MNDSVRALTRSALSASVGVVLLYLGSVVPGGKLAFLFLSTLGVVFIRLCCPWQWSLGCYAVTAACAAFLLPTKALAVFYAVFFGYYPLLKMLTERISSLGVRLLLRLGLFNAVFFGLWFLARALFSQAIGSAMAPVWLLWIAANIGFLIYDYALGQMILYYLRNIAGRIK